jgi:hypothetical protein
MVRPLYLIPYTPGSERRLKIRIKEILEAKIAPRTTTLQLVTRLKELMNNILSTFSLERGLWDPIEDCYRESSDEGYCRSE